MLSTTFDLNCCLLGLISDGEARLAINMLDDTVFLKSVIVATGDGTFLTVLTPKTCVLDKTLVFLFCLYLDI